MSLTTKKIVMITGATAGLGRELALQTAKRGGKTALLARRAELLETVQREIKTLGGEALIIPTDISDAESVHEAFAEVLDVWPVIDVLFNNAGVIEPIAPLTECSDEALRNLFMINIFGTYVVAREALKIMRGQENGGVIINISSGAAYKPYPGWSAYGGSKAAVDQMTRTVAIENKDRPVNIFAIAPGVFASPMQQKIRGTPVERFPRLQRFINLHEQGQLADPADIADALIQIGLAPWPALNGRVEDIRSAEFQRECRERGIVFPNAIRVNE